jgi:hypothetical protein
VVVDGVRRAREEAVPVENELYDAQRTGRMPTPRRGRLGPSGERGTLTQQGGRGSYEFSLTEGRLAHTRVGSVWRRAQHKPPPPPPRVLGRQFTALERSGCWRRLYRVCHRVPAWDCLACKVAC